MAFTEKYVSALAGGAGTGTVGSPYTWAQMLTLVGGATSQASVRFNIRADGTYTRASGDDFAGGVGGAATGPVVLRGYKTTPGDGWLGRNADGTIITTNMPLITYGPSDCWFKTPPLTVVETLHLQGHASGEFATLQNHSAFIGCRINFDGSNGSGSAARVGNDNCIAYETDFDMTVSGSTNFVVRSTAGGARLDSCRITTVSPTCGGIQPDQVVTISRCLLKGGGGSAGVYQNDPNRQTIVIGCTITNFGSGIKIESAGQRELMFAGNLITDCSAYGFELTDTSFMGIIGNNRVRDCALGVTNATANVSDWAQAGRIIPLNTTDTGGPTSDYRNPAAGDYTLITTSPSHNTNTPVNTDYGCYGAPDATGGGGSALFHPLKPFIIRGA